MTDQNSFLKNFGAICFFLEKVIFQLGITIRLVSYLLWLWKIKISTYLQNSAHTPIIC